MSEAAGNFDFMELGQAIMDAREKQRITREELAEELGISARHLQSIEKEGQYPSFPLFIQLVTMFHISVDQYIHPEATTEKTTLRRQLDALFDTFDDSDLTIIAGTAQGIGFHLRTDRAYRAEIAAAHHAEESAEQKDNSQNKDGYPSPCSNGAYQCFCPGYDCFYCACCGFCRCPHCLFRRPCRLPCCPCCFFRCLYGRFRRCFCGLCRLLCGFYGFPCGLLGGFYGFCGRFDCPFPGILHGLPRFPCGLDRFFAPVYGLDGLLGKLPDLRRPLL